MPEHRIFYKHVRELIHAMRNHLSVIAGSAGLLRDTRQALVSSDVRQELDRIERNIKALTILVEDTASLTLPALATSSSNGDFWEVTCLEKDQLDEQSLRLFLGHLVRCYPSLATGNLIVVASETRLVSLQRFFARGQWKTRYATAPVDVDYMYQSPPRAGGKLLAPRVDAIIMAPPAREAAQWWRDLRYMIESPPVLIYLRSSELLIPPRLERNSG